MDYGTEKRPRSKGLYSHRERERERGRERGREATLIEMVR
jgi:hypothetical protein